MQGDQIRQLANGLRKVAADAETARMIRCAQTLKAAHALNLIRKKVASHVR